MLRLKTSVDELEIVSISFKYSDGLPIMKWVDVMIMNTSESTLADVAVTKAHGVHPIAGPLLLQKRPVIIAETLRPLEHCIVTVPLTMDYVEIWLDVAYEVSGTRRAASFKAAEYPDRDDWESHGVYNLLDGNPYRGGFAEPMFQARIAAMAEVLAKAAESPELLRVTSPARFEEIVGELLARFGFAVEHVGRSGDGGVDLVAIQDNLFSATRQIVQCKRYNHKVGVAFVRELYGVKTDLRASKAVLVTTSSFTKGALEFAERNAWELQLVDFDRLKNLLRDATA